MKQTHYLTATVQKGNRLEINLPELEEGQNVEIILIVPESHQQMKTNTTICDQSNNMKQNIMKKSLAECRKLLAQQAEAIQQHYEQDKSWQEWTNLDLANLS